MEDEIINPNLYINQIARGGVINSSTMATKMAAIVIEGLYGKEELLKQEPLRSVDQGDSWLVEGSYQHPGGAPGDHSSYIVIRKYDAAVTELGHRLAMDVPSDVEAIIARARAKKTKEKR